MHRSRVGCGLIRAVRAVLLLAVLPLAVLAVQGCTADSARGGNVPLAGSSTTGSAASTGTETGGAVDTGDTGGSYWTLDADLVLVDGAVDPASSQLRLGRRSGGSETCSETLGITDVTDIKFLPSDQVLTWWELSWDGTSLACFAEGEGAAEQPFRLGVGLMHPEMVAVLDVVDEVSTTAAADSLNAAYLQLNGDDRLLVYGLAGPAAAYAGDGKPADQAPLADGTWLIRSAYSLPLTW